MSASTSTPGTYEREFNDGVRMTFIDSEELVPPYTLPDPLRFKDGSPVRSAQDWQKRRAEVMEIVLDQVYGRVPDVPYKVEVEVEEELSPAMDGKALRKQIIVWVKTAKGSLPIHVLLYLPACAAPEHPVPAFLGLNFAGNHTVYDDPAIVMPTAWCAFPISEEGRGKAARGWMADEIIANGYALATAYCGEIDPDFHDEFQNGLHPLFYAEGQTHPAPDEWGTIGAWAFGLSRILDALELEPLVDGKRVAVTGCSRLGKTAVWAGASDERFAMVVSSVSGCGGAAISRRLFGEHLAAINHNFPHWFCENFKQYSGNETALPVDQHQVLSLIAPRPLYVQSGVEDLWSDPHGEFLGALGASPVYELLCGEGLPQQSLPEVDAVDFSGRIAYHIRSGGHGIFPWDWTQFIRFADRFLK
ncbi:MAG: hypothetical protein JW750_09650 [Anaerolineaceae bacterium]|nr:hypothetical protein [Anaerolineaceae bacterium]